MKKTVGLPISKKENERRRVLLPENLKRFPDSSLLYFEKGYGEELGYSDEDFKKCGCHVVSRKETLTKDIICDVKIGDSDYLKNVKNKTIFGWIHLEGNKPLKNILIHNKLTVYAWEDMFSSSRHLFWKNNQTAGEAAVIHAFQCYGELPYRKKVAILGRGNVAYGALKILNLFGAEVTMYSSKTQKLFRKEFAEYDVIVNATLWDTNRTDHMLYKSELKSLKKNAFIIDVSCDRAGAIESSYPTTIENPVYFEQGVLHYVVDHTPSLLFRKATKNISKAVLPYIGRLINEDEDDVLLKCKLSQDGVLLKDDIPLLSFSDPETAKRFQPVIL